MQLELAKRMDHPLLALYSSVSQCTCASHTSLAPQSMESIFSQSYQIKLNFLWLPLLATQLFLPLKMAAAWLHGALLIIDHAFRISSIAFVLVNFSLSWVQHWNNIYNNWWLKKVRTLKSIHYLSCVHIFGGTFILHTSITHFSVMDSQVFCLHPAISYTLFLMTSATFESNLNLYFTFNLETNIQILIIEEGTDAQVLLNYL